MTLYFVINGSPYTDRSLRALTRGFVSLIGKQFKVYNFHKGGFGSDSLRTSKNDVCILYGNLRDYSSSISRPRIRSNDVLIDFLERFPGKKFWMTGYDADLDHYPEDLLWGLKTEKFESQRESFDTTPFELFDGLVWPGEDLLKNDEPIDFPVLESKHWEPEFIRMKRRVLNNSLLELQSLFSKRIVNAHCIPSEALKYGRRTLHMYRQYPIGLVGAYYNNRIYIKDILKRSRVKNAPFDEYERFVSRTNGAIGKLEALGVDGVRIKKMQRAIRFLSQQSLFLQSKMAWVDPGYFGYLVRKYFEAPMAGAALIGQTNFSNESKGFIKDTTMLVSEGQDVIDLIQVSERERLCLVNNSLDMLSELHTGEARAKQILKGITDESTEYIYTFRGAKHVKLNGEKE